MSSEPKTPEKSFDEVILETFVNIFTCNIGSPQPHDDTTTYNISQRSDHEIARDKYRQNLSRSTTTQNSISSRPQQQHASFNLEEHTRKLKEEEDFKLNKNKEFSEKVSNEPGVLNFFGLASSKSTKSDNNTDINSNLSTEQFEYFLGTEGVEAVIWLPTPKGKAKGKTSRIKLDRLTNSIKCEMVSKGERKSLFFQLTDLSAISNGKGTGSTGTMTILLPPEAEDHRTLYITIKEKPELNLTFSNTTERDTFVKGMRMLIIKSNTSGNQNAAQAQLQSLLSKVKK